jgi:hypothetical protein
MASVVSPLRCYLVEWYRAALVGETVDHFTAVLDDCAASISAGGGRVQLLTVLAVPADEVLFGVFAATSEDLVARACLQAGIPAQRLSDAIDARIAHL